MMVCNCKVLNNEDLMKYGVDGMNTNLFNHTQKPLPAYQLHSKGFCINKATYPNFFL